MKNYFLGFFLDSTSNHKVRKVVGEVGRVFDGQDINVRWNKPDNYHISLLYIGLNINPINLFFIESKLKKIRIPRFKISLDKCDLGIVRHYKGLVYLSVKDGGEHLRDLVFTFRNTFNSGDASIYLPHLSLGRASKDLSNEEQRNIQSDLRNITPSLKLNEIVFDSTSLYLVESTNGDYKLLKKLETI